MSLLPSLKETDKDSIKLGFSESKEVMHLKCSHDVYAINGSEAKCRNCSVGWSGPNILELVASFNKL